MSEYQYYEFQAIDRPLTLKEIETLRSYSTRARITPTSFINEYHWGDFKGNADVWVEKYFDAFFYFANWGTHVLMLRLPSHRLPLAIARKYCHGRSVSVREKTGKIILSFISENEEYYEWDEEGNQLSSIIAVRNELAQGDLRALYLGWLLQLQAGEIHAKEIEPPIPPGLNELSASLKNLADFLYIDSDLLHIAAQDGR